MRTILLTLLALVNCTFALAQVPAGHTVWFDQAIASESSTEAFAQEWETRSLPLGNGSLGANVMGTVATEVFTLNEKSLWMGGPGIAEGPKAYWDANKESAAVLKDIRRAFKAGDYERAQQLTEDNFNGTIAYTTDRFGGFTTLGRLTIGTSHSDDDASGYVRALSVDSAFATVSYSLDGIRYERRSFISFPDNVLAVRFSASQPGRQNLTIGYTPNSTALGQTTAEGNDGLHWTGRLANNGMQHDVRIRAITRGGSVSTDGEHITVSGANEVLLLLTADTDYAPNYDPDFNDAKAYVGVDPDKTTAKWMKAAAKKTFDKLFAAHLKDYKALYDRVDLTFGSTAASTAALPTDRRLAAYRLKPDDSALEELYFHYGRYLLIASSRPGNLPANLQGIWALGVDSPWHADYHNNINVQMNYWPALSCALVECQEPLTDFIRMQRKAGAVTAKKYFNARGWMAGISSNPFGFTSPLSSKDMTWNLNPVAAAWLATHLWEQYDFTRDEAFLRTTAYPIIKECANFCCDYLWQMDDGTLTAAPSTSPEHGPVDAGTTFTHAVIREVLAEAIAAAGLMNVDGNDINIWSNTLTSLAPYQVGRYGQLQEWSRDIDDPADRHRHVNHLFGLHPGSSITPLDNPELADAARIVLEHRGDATTSWAIAWKLNLWARLYEAQRSHELLQSLLTTQTNDNLWSSQPPFQIDGNFGGTAGIAEMLLQSHANCVHLLPALPATWGEGSVKGLRARGGFVIDMTWADGTLTSATVKSLVDGVCTVRYGDSSIDFETTAGKSYTLVPYNGYLKVK